MGSEQSKGELQTTTTDQTNPDECTCQICGCLFYNPVRLSCCHSFCEVCVEVHWELESTQTELSCPQAKCEQKWESKPKVRKDTTLETVAEEAREKLVSVKLYEIQWVAKKGGATDERNASSPQSSPPAQDGGEEWSKAHSKLVEVFPEWKKKRIGVLKMLADMIVQLKKRARDGNISKVAGSSASIAGGAMAIAGIALIPVTFGASLGLTIAGTATGVAGGITAAGASIAVLVMNKASTKEATENIEKDKIAGEKLAEAVQSIYLAVSKLNVVTMATLVTKVTCEKIETYVEISFDKWAWRGFLTGIDMARNAKLAAEGAKLAAVDTTVAGASTKMAVKGAKLAAEGATVAAFGATVATISAKVATESTKVAVEGTKVAAVATKMAMQSTKMAVVGTKVAVEGAKVAVEGAKVADDVALAVVKGVASGGLRVAGIAVSSVFLVVDVASLILAGVDLHKGSPSKIAEHWQKTYDDLKLHLIHMAKTTDYIQRNRK
ncbi:uncharacterized protein LOC133359671 [Lethenteron reissneri]|uniref:uncharacterized protein LOC133359671 n=1 Tax=Lethenteron reissneri TaxID=7753 RepID=UPI002AB646F7|nr:uncharacterized protein LOC133359671 [Lethenteron reissneri]